MHKSIITTELNKCQPDIDNINCAKTIDCVAILSTSPSEYAALNDELKENQLVDAMPTGNLYLLSKPIQTNYGNLYFVKIRKPDENLSNYRVYVDFTVDNYESYKSNQNHPTIKTHSTLEYIEHKTDTSIINVVSLSAKDAYRPNIDGIIFDLDGVLWSTVDSCVKVLTEAKTQHAEITRDVTADEVVSCMGLPFDTIVERYYGYIDKDRATVIAREAFENNIKNLLENGGTPYPELENTIKTLAEKYKLCIVSNCIEGYVESFLRTSGLGSYFCDHECNGKTKLSKGENIKLVMSRNNIKTAVFVGDTLGDKEAADYAGIPFVYASYGFGKVEQCDYKIDTLKDLVKIFFAKK